VAVFRSWIARFHRSAQVARRHEAITGWPQVGYGQPRASGTENLIDI